MLWLVLACASAAALAEQPAAPARLVTIDQGPVRGYKHPDYEVFVFRSIPYATAPTGRDRYKAPLPPRNWTEPFEAVAQGIICPQGTAIGANEDCLITNVYVPDTLETNLPVMVTVHGGAFQVGAGDDEPQANLVDSKKMIVVNFNYRLGVHGFLCLGNEEAPGNAGMKDQVALLRWVQRNIAAFGGNPNDVTLCGCSAGGASVDLLRLSSSTSGLFNKAIVGSGGNAGSFGIQNDPLENAKEYARLLNFEDADDLAALTEFYTTSSLETVFSKSHLASNRPDSTVLWAPCVENDLGIERFLEEAPVTILKKGEHSQVPILYGFAEHEGIIRVPFFQNWRNMMNDQFSDFLPGDLKFSSVEEKEQVARRVKEFYFGNETVHEGNILRYIDLFTDMLFGYTMLRSVKLNAEYGSSTIYLYEFSFADENSMMIPHANIRGVPHCMQFMIFGDQDETGITPERRHVMTAMRKMIQDFVTTGNPVSEDSTLSVWPAANAIRAPHMNLDYQSELRGPLHQERAELWDSIYEAHYRTPIPPGTPDTDEDDDDDDGDDNENGASVLSISILSIVYAMVLILIH